MHSVASRSDIFEEPCIESRSDFKQEQYNMANRVIVEDNVLQIVYLFLHIMPSSACQAFLDGNSLMPSFDFCITYMHHIYFSSSYAMAFL